MYFDLEDYRPDTPRVPSAISIREGVLMSLLLHALLVIAYLLAPASHPVEATPLVAQMPQRDAVTFVNIAPAMERPAPPKPNVDQSDLDRRASAPERAPDQTNIQPFSRGDTSEKVVGGRDERMAGPENPVPAPSPTPTTSAATSTADAGVRSSTEPTLPAAAQTSAGGALGRSLRNLTRYLQDQNYDNQQGALNDQGPDIQFDSKGVEFGPWLRRFLALIKRNWYVPQAAMLMSGQVVIQCYVQKDGRIVEIKVVKPSTTEAYTISAFNALKNSNPALPLPAEYPDDRAFFTITFHYDVR